MVDFLTPYAVDDSVIPAAGLRRQYQDSTQGSSGVTLAGDLRVTQMDVPGAGVKVAAGNDTILCRAPGRSRESYGISHTTDENYLGDAGTGIPGTGSSGGRRDMIIHEVVDPSLPRTYTPREQIPEGVYSKITVVQGVPSTATRVEHVPALNEVTAESLAVIDWPASTATITSGMIKDVRRVTLPKELVQARGFGCQVSALDPVSSTAAYPAGETWPSEAVTNEKLRLFVPEWATEVTTVMTVSGTWVPSVGSSNGWFWVQVGNSVDPANFKTEPTKWDIDEQSKPHRTVVRTADTKPIPASMRGTWQHFFPRATRTSGTNANAIGADSGTSVDLLVVFRQTPL